MNKDSLIPKDLASQLLTHGLDPTDLVVYINSSCNLRCKHCYLGNSLLSQSLQFNAKSLVCFINSIRYIDRLTILGGEATLHPSFEEIFRMIDIKKINTLRLTTNGLNIKPILRIDKDKIKKLTISISLDGHEQKVHESIRGKNTYNRTVNNIKTLVSLGFDVEITHTVMRSNFNKLNGFISFIKSIGVRKLNLHKMSLQGNAVENDTLFISPTQYREAINKIFSLKKTNGDFVIRFPMLFLTKEEYEKQNNKHSHSDKSYYSDGNRIVIYPDKKIFVSSELFGTNSHIGCFNDEKFFYNIEATNEIEFFRREKNASIQSLNPRQSGDINYPYITSVSKKEQLII